MKLILDENLPAYVKEEITEFHDNEYIDVNDEYKGILDFKLVDKMDKKDIMVTRDRELHKNLLDVEKKSVYYDIEMDNLIEVQVKIAYYLKGYDSEEVHKETEENKKIDNECNSQLRSRFKELKKENARLKSRVNVLEGKIKSILNTAESAVD
ncbi:MAG: hypothetical protein ACOC5D_03535 [Thermoplasmatota archaeon]